MVKKVAGIFGIIFIIVAILGFFTPGGLSMQANPNRAGHLLGLFPVNILHNIVHLGFGIWGLMAARSWDGARTYARVAGPLYILLAVLGFVTASGFGLVPLGGHDIWLHLLIGAVLTAVGYSAATVEPGAPMRTGAAARA